MRLLLRNKVGMSVLLTFLVLCLAAGAFALTGFNAAHAAGPAVTPNHHSGGGGHHGNGGCDPKSSFFANPCVAVEDTNGVVSFVIQGQKLIPLETYVVSSPALDLACNTSITPTYETTDLTGRFNDLFTNYYTGGACVAGTYEIELQEYHSPYTVYSTHVTIKFPHR